MNEIEEEVIGAIVDTGVSPTEAREMFGPFVALSDEESDLGSHVNDPSQREEALRQVLTRARDDRQPPGPQAVAPAGKGLIHVPEHAHEAKLVRVDTEESYRDFRQSGGDADVDESLDLHDPENSEYATDDVAERAQAELLGDFERGYASQWVVGRDGRRARLGDIMDMLPASRGSMGHGVYDSIVGHRSRVGDIMSMIPASRGSMEHDTYEPLLGNVGDLQPASRGSMGSYDGAYHSAFSADQACLLCGRSGGSPVCEGCNARADEILGLFDRGYASQIIGRDGRVGDIMNMGPASRRQYDQELLGLFDRGAAASLYDDNPSVTLGAEEFYRLPMHERQYDGGSAVFFSDLPALRALSADEPEVIPLSYAKAETAKHVSTWKQGDHIYGSIRVTGWDRKPRILTTVTGYTKELGIVVGYSNSASIAPSHTIAILDPLARQLGASRLLPRLAAAAPAVLRVAAHKAAPIVLTALPAHADDSWVV